MWEMSIARIIRVEKIGSKSVSYNCRSSITRLIGTHTYVWNDKKIDWLRSCVCVNSWHFRVRPKYTDMNFRFKYILSLKKFSNIAGIGLRAGKCNASFHDLPSLRCKRQILRFDEGSERLYASSTGVNKLVIEMGECVCDLLRLRLHVKPIFLHAIQTHLNDELCDECWFFCLDNVWDFFVSFFKSPHQCWKKIHLQLCSPISLHIYRLHEYSITFGTKIISYCVNSSDWCTSQADEVFLLKSHKHSLMDVVVNAWSHQKYTANGGVLRRLQSPLHSTKRQKKATKFCSTHVRVAHK